MLVDNINILKSESEKEYIEDSKLLLDHIKMNSQEQWMEKQRTVNDRIWMHM